MMDESENHPLTSMSEEKRSSVDTEDAITPNLIDDDQINTLDSIKSYKRRHDFKIIWNNLSYKIDSRPWYQKTREKLIRRDPSFNNSTSEDSNHRSRERKILNKLCGSINSGELTGILGPSGAGKSTLLNCLFRNCSIGTTGQILVDSGRKKRLKVCFIPQKDYLNEWLTVREDLIFVSKLKSARVSGILRNDLNSSIQHDNETNCDEIPNTYVHHDNNRSKTTLIDHDANALRVAELLGLSSCLDVLIRNISGGQKKRLSIARELMSKPNILVLDEPTTGLDSLTCLKTMQVLRDLIRHSTHPLAVVVTIHQPPGSVFNLFDKTYFVSNKGQLVYDGNPKDLAETLQTVASVRMPSLHCNQASTLIEISSNPAKNDIVDSLTSHQRLKFQQEHDTSYLKTLVQAKSSNWKLCAISGSRSVNDSFSTEQYEEQQAIKTSSCQSAGPKEESPDNDYSSLSSMSEDYFISHQLQDCLSSHSSNLLQSFSHIFILTHRSWLSNIRNPTLTKSRLVFHAALPLIMLMIFGTHSGTPNSCPAFNVDLNIADMQKSLGDSTIKRNVDEIRLAAENVSFYFILMYGFGMNIISSTASYYPLTIHMFKKETTNGLYSAGPYLIGQTLAELPLEIFFPSFSVILGYSLSGQIASYLEWRMFAITLMVLSLCYTVHSLGLLFGSIFVNNINVAVLIGQVALFPSVVLSGFVVRTPRMPDWMHNLSILSFFKHSIKGIVAARYGFNVCECDEDMFSEDEHSGGVSGMPPHVKNVLNYMFPTNSTDEIKTSEIFDKLSERFTKAQTFALNITSCDDVKPYIMTSFGVEDSHLLRGFIALIIMITILKFLTFSIVKLSPYRIR